MSGKLSFNLFNFTQHDLERKFRDPFYPTLIFIRKVCFLSTLLFQVDNMATGDLVFRSISLLERCWAIKTKLVVCLRKSV